MKKSAILFSKDHVKFIEFEHRLPPSAIGVRRVCPSSKEVMKELKRLKRVKKEQKIHNNASSTCTSKRDGDGVNPDDDPGPLKTETKETSAYYQLSVDSKLIQEEVDEIKGIDRAAFNNLPAFLSAPMTQQASKHKLLLSHRKDDPLSTLEEDRSNSCNIDDELATSWALQLRKSMEAAEGLRAKENMRPMAYRLVPEAWSRHRDSAVGAGENDDDNAADDDGQDEGKTKDDQHKNICSNNNNSTNEDNKSSNAFIFVNNIRPVSNNEWRDETHSIVYDCLYNQFPKLHISCGAKFGCDYLLYDGNRKMRHAFAGVRVLMSKIDSRGEIDFNIPTTYNLHGYVRGLNTAGKLALLATVIPSSENEGGYRVAIVDLALEKILSAPTHLKKRKRSNNARKEIGVNLAKVGSDVVESSACTLRGTMVHQYKRQEIMNARKVETLTQNRRAEEQRVKGLLRYNSECQRLSNMTVNNSRRASVESLVDTEREKRRALELKRKEDILKKAEADEAERERQQKSMERGKLEREIQCICDSSEELRELERNIKIAYVNKERAAQHQESLLIKNIENAREQMIEEEMERKRQNLIRIEEEKDKHRRDKLVAQKTVLQGQMREHEIQMEEAKKEALKDKEVVDNILRQINEESRVEVKKKNKKRDGTKAMIKHYQAERDEFKRLLAQEEKDQEDRINSYDSMMQQREEKKKRKEIEAANQKKLVWKKVAEDTKNFNQARDDYNDLRDLLWDQERQEREKVEEEEAEIKRLKLREELLHQNQEQIQAKKALMARMEEEEANLVKEMLDKFAADEENEWQSQIAAMHSKVQYVSEARRQREERERMFKEEKEKETKEMDKVAEIEEYKQAVIAEARKRLLEAHAAQLQDFLPAVK